MSETPDPKEQLARLDQAIAGQEALRGIVPTEQVDRTLGELRAQREVLVAQVSGSGAIAQEHGVAAGAGGVAIGEVKGNLHLQTGAPAPPGAGPVVLRRIYLERLVEETRHILLGGVDPSLASSDSKPRLELASVYTALLTRSSVAEDGKEPKETRLEAREERRSVSALEALDRSRCLVLLGDPGSGKSTFVSFVSLCLAGEALGRSEANLERLTEPLPTEEPDKEEQRQPWRHGALLPVRVVLRDFAARGLPAAGCRATAQDLWGFLDRELSSCGLGELWPHLKGDLQERGGLVLLDGLDEVPEASSRRVQLKEAVEDFVHGLPGCRFLVTSRTYAYQRQDWRLGGFEEVVLAPLGEAQIARFVDRWYASVAPLRGLEDFPGRAEALKRALLSNARLRELAERPLLLTLMASLHLWRGGTLPEQREKLYSDAVELLLDLWEEQRVTYDREGKRVVLEPSLVEWLKVDHGKVRQLLERLAYEAHSRQEDLVGTADIKEGDLLSGLLALSRNPETNPGRLLEFLSHRAGIVVARGVEVYTFPHRTFQEYLAACHLTSLDYPDRVAELGRKDADRWREVVLLAGARGRVVPSTVWQLAEALCFREVGDGEVSEEDEWGARLAGALLAESADLQQVSERDRPKLERVRSWQVALLRSERLPAVERVGAGVSLSRLGDRRFSEEQWNLPSEPLLGFLEVPAGVFLMGSDPEKDGSAYEDEQPQHELELPRYFVGRYPVTVGQYRKFVESTGFRPGNRDCLVGEETEPVVLVSWEEVVSYCRWLGNCVRELSEDRSRSASGESEAFFWGGLLRGELGVGLPSEAEWEKASRGVDGRIYPWGGDLEADRASYAETGLGARSVVGSFGRWSSPYGCEEMVGNVWEWTRTLWSKGWKGTDFGYRYVAEDGREDPEAAGPRVVRGGSFLNLQWFARCAVRDWFNPDFRDGNIGFRLVVSPFFSEL